MDITCVEQCQEVAAASQYWKYPQTSNHLITKQHSKLDVDSQSLRESNNKTQVSIQQETSSSLSLMQSHEEIEARD